MNNYMSGEKWGFPCVTLRYAHFPLYKAVEPP